MGDWGDVEQLMNSLQMTVLPSEPITTEWMKNRLELVESKSKSIYNNENSAKGVIQIQKVPTQLVFFFSFSFFEKILSTAIFNTVESH